MSVILFKGNDKEQEEYNLNLEYKYDIYIVAKGLQSRKTTH